MAWISPSPPAQNLLGQQPCVKQLLAPKTCSSSSSCRMIKAMASPTIIAPRREKDPKKRIVITGMGLVSVLGSQVDMFYDRLLAGESGIRMIKEFNVSDFPVQFAGKISGFSPEGYVDMRKHDFLDPFCEYALVAGKKALSDANLGQEVLEKMDRTRIGVIIGSGTGGATIYATQVQQFLDDGKCELPAYSFLYSTVNAAAAILALEAGLTGVCYSISTACASSNYCIYAAANHIRRGEADIILAGGTEAGIIRHGMAGFIACRALSQRNDAPEQASRPWDKDRDGFVIGEGCGLLVMESLEHAQKRGANIVAEYLGGATTCDAYHLTDPRPDGLGVSSCIAKALHHAGVSPEEVNYVNAHATSTRTGDLAEVIAMKKVFKDTSEMKMNSTKSLIGHGLGAAGGLEAIATIQAMKTGWLHPTLNQHNLDPEVTIDTVPNKKKKHEVNVGISNSFGFGGHNAVIVLSPFRP